MFKIILFCNLQLKIFKIQAFTIFAWRVYYLKIGRNKMFGFLFTHSIRKSLTCSYTFFGIYSFFQKLFWEFGIFTKNTIALTFPSRHYISLLGTRVIHFFSFNFVNHLCTKVSKNKVRKYCNTNLKYEKQNSILCQKYCSAANENKN